MPTPTLTAPEDRTIGIIDQQVLHIAVSFAQIETAFGPSYSETASTAVAVADLIHPTSQQHSLDIEAARTYVQSLSHTPQIAISTTPDHSASPTDLTSQNAAHAPEVAHAPSIDRGGYSM